MVGLLRAILAVVMLVPLAVPVSAVARTPARPDAVSVLGVTQIRGRDVFVSILALVPPGDDERAVAAEALRRRGARPPRPDEVHSLPFSTYGVFWGQFLDADRRNNIVTQYYNPAGDPTGGGGLLAVQNSQATWSGVETSSFRIQFGGTTDRCPSLVPECAAPDPFDGFSDVGWVSLDEPNFLGFAYLAWFTDSFHIVDADVALNLALFPGATWATDGQDGPGRFDVETVILHENGHVAGLDHSLDPESIMFPTYHGVQRTLGLDDIDGISFLYPRHIKRNPTTPPPHAGPPPFTQVAALWPADGSTGPGGITFDAYFEPGALGIAGDAAFTAAFFGPEGAGEGVFRARGDTIAQIAATGLPAPGGGTFGAGVWGRVAMNNAGDLAFVFVLEPFALPIGTNAGVYRYLDADGTLQPVVVPNVTPAPGGGLFLGAHEPSLNNAGEVAFAGIVPTTAGIADDTGMGVFVADRDGRIRVVARPGDPAPGGGVFDYADEPFINDRGDVVFSAHVAGEECIATEPQELRIRCLSGIYVRRAGSGRIETVAQQGAPVPGVGTLRAAFGATINNRGDVLFIGDLTPDPESAQTLGVFLHTGGQLVTVARPGDPMPGGGNFVTAGLFRRNWSLNNTGQVAFSAVLDSDDDGDWTPDNGVYVWSGGALRLVARSGTVLPDLGTVAQIQPPYLYGAPWTFGGAVINDRGEVLFQATLNDQVTGVLVRASAHP